MHQSVWLSIYLLIMRCTASAYMPNGQVARSSIKTDVSRELDPFLSWPQQIYGNGCRKTIGRWILRNLLCENYWQFLSKTSGMDNLKGVLTYERKAFMALCTPRYYTSQYLTVTVTFVGVQLVSFVTATEEWRGRIDALLSTLTHAFVETLVDVLRWKER